MDHTNVPMKKPWQVFFSLLAITGAILAVPYCAKQAAATVSNQNSRVVSSLGNGSTTNYTISIPFQSNSQIKVYLQDESSSPYTRSLLVYGAGAGKYTITGGDPGTTVVMGTAPSTSQRVIIVRDIPITQSVDYSETEAFPAEDHEQAMDKMTMILQQMNTSVGEKVGLSAGSTATTPTFPDPSADRFVLYNHAGTDLTLSPSSAPSSGDVLKFNGSAWTNYSLSGALAAEDAALAAHIANGTGAHAASAISNSPSGNLAATNVQSALNELQSDIDTRATSSALSAHIADTSNPHAVTANQIGANNIISEVNTNGSDTINWARVSKTGSNLTDLVTRNHSDLAGVGTNTHAQIDAHIANTSNPHNVTAAQVGNTTAQWNANKIQGVTVDDSAKANGKSLVYDSGSGNIVYQTVSGGGTSSLLNSHIFVGDASNNAADVPMSGDATIDNTGAVTIANSAVTNAKVAAGAAITRSKLASGTANHVVINDGSGVLSSEATLAKSRGGAGADMSSVTFPGSGTITTDDGSSTLTNKTINAASNTISNISDTEIKVGAEITRSKLASGTANHVIINDGSGVISSEATLAKSRGGAGADMSSVTFPSSGTLVTTTGTQALTNKDIDGATASNTSRITLPADTTANLAALTRKAGTIMFDTSASRPVFDDGSVVKSMSGAGGLYEGGQNLITNNSWEYGTSNWTASGGSYARVTAAANIVPPGIGAASWDPSAGSQTLTANTVTITSNDGISGRNGVLSCAVKTAATDLKMQVYDGSSVISPNASTDVVPSSSAGFVRYSVNFIFPSSGTVSARFLSQSDSAIAYIDNCYLGLAEGFNVSNISQASFYGGVIWPGTTNCTWSRTTNASFGSYSADADCTTPTGSNLLGNGQAPSTKIPAIKFTNMPPGEYEVLAFGDLTSQTSGAACSYRLSDGTNASSPVSIFAGGASAAGSPAVIGHFSYTTTADRTIEVQGTGTASSVQCDIFASIANIVNLQFLVYRYPSASEQAYRPDTAPASWSGYHDNTCSWNRAAATLGDTGADATCVFTERYNRNFGTVSSVAGLQPAISVNFPTVGRYRVCAITSVNGSTTLTGSFGLSDGTTTFTTAAMGLDTTYKSMQLCGTYNATSTSATTLKIVAAASTGSTNVGATGSIANAIEWTIESLDTPKNAPVLVGSVTSNSTGAERVEHASVTSTCSASPCTIASQSGSWLSSITWNSTGNYTPNFAAGMFSGAPVCGVISLTGGANIVYTTLAPTTSGFTFQTNSVGTTPANAAFQIWCKGPR